MAKPDFTKVWASSRVSIPEVVSGDYAQGWQFRNGLPPRVDNFDYAMNLQDQRAIWLQEQLPAAGTTSYARTLMDDDDAVTARQTLGLGGGAGGDFIPVARLPAATETAIGAVEKATTAETEAGAADKYPDAASIAATYEKKTQPSMTGSVTLNGATNNTVVMTGIVTELGLEIGDVIRIDTGTYNKLHTVESITDNSSIIVNYEHAGNRGDGSLKLPDFTGQATVTRIAKWFNAPTGVGQTWQDVTASREAGVSYTNTTGRTILVAATAIENINLNVTIIGFVGSQQVLQSTVSSPSGGGGVPSITFAVPPGAIYSCELGSGDSLFSWVELR